MTETFDFVIMGGGVAGCVLANRLSADPKTRVCLVEAGGKGQSVLTWLPFAMLATIPGYVNNWRFETVPQPGLGGRRMYQPRGKALGGSSAINAMICTRGVPADYDGWGVPGWAYEDMLPFFKRSESHFGGQSPVHGGNGPQPVNELRDLRPIGEAFLTAAQRLQYPKRDDFNDGADTYGVGTYHVFQKNGERYSAARSYLGQGVAERDNLEVFTSSRFQDLIWSEGRVSGVKVKRGGEVLSLKAQREVILCGGAFGSPHMLQLAGIGDPEDLKAAGLAVRHALPSVGKNLSDHLDVKVHIRDRSGQGTSLNPANAVRHLLPGIRTYLKARRGPLATNFAEVGGFGRSGVREGVTDLQFHLTCAGVFNHGKRLPLRSLATLNTCNLYPFSRGTVRPNGPKPESKPLIDPAYLSDERDLEVLKVGLAKALQIVEGEGFIAEAGPVHSPARGTDPEDHIRAKAETIYHPAGTCRMGTDEASVVDPELRVRGVQGLRVVDAAIMPSLIGGNTTAPTMALAERAADLILR